MMLYSSLLALAASVSLVAAADHQVVVGGDAGLVYTPSNITAAVGDTVTFLFEHANHTATQSSFATPCSPLVNTTTGASGFDSGFVPVPSGAASVPAWTLEVLVSTPIWVYCRQTGHCEQGMVFAINAATTGNKTYADFVALARSATPSTDTGTTVASSGIGATAAGALSTVSANAAGSTSTSTSSGSSPYNSPSPTPGAASIHRPAVAWSIGGLALAAVLAL